jgi:ABC-type multidrug transport system ATPase subunit
VPQGLGLYDDLTLAENLAFSAAVFGEGPAAASLPEPLRRYGTTVVGSLPLGIQRTAAFTQALAHRPDLLVLDEPLAGLDPVAQSEILSLFAEFRAGGGAILFSTHSMSAAETLSDQVVMLAGGRTVFEGPLAQASASAPHGAVVVTTDAEGLQAAARALGGDAQPMPGRIGEATRWRVSLPREVTHPALMRALAERAVAIFAFEPIKADLEAAFWELAAPAARPDHRRAA